MICYGLLMKAIDVFVLLPIKYDRKYVTYIIIYRKGLFDGSSKY